MKSKKGTILITTLWILGLLTLLALGIGARIGIDIKLMGFFLNSLKAHYLAQAGLRKTIALLEADGSKLTDSVNEPWSCGFDFDDEEYILKDIELGEGSFTVSYEFGTDEEWNLIYLYGASDEEGKLNINKIDDDLLYKLPGISSEMVAAILDWRDEDSLERFEGAEDDYYGSLDNPYECKDAPFSAPEELMLVKGLTEEIYDGIKDIITVYPLDGDGKVNINTASESVLAVLAGQDFERIPTKIINYRNGPDGLPGTEDDKIFNDIRAIPAQAGLDQIEQIIFDNIKQYFKFSSNTFRIVSCGEVRNGRVKKTIEAVVKRDNKESPILYYYEH